MKIDNRFSRVIIVILMLITAICFSSCSAQKKPILKKPGTAQEEKQPPKELETLKKSIDKIEKSLQELYDENRKPMVLLQEELSKQQKKNDKGSEKNGSDSQSKNQQSSESKDNSSNQSEKPLTEEEVKKILEQKLYTKMEDIKKDVAELHSQWNTYEPKAVSDLAPQAAIDEFKGSLNSLTSAVEARNLFESLLQVNQLYKYLPDFYMLYNPSTPPELDRLKFAIKKIMLTSGAADFNTANAALGYLDNTWAAAKPKLKKDNIDEINKFEFALKDLHNAVTAQNVTIAAVKANVMLKTIDEIEKKSKSSSK